MTTTTQHANDVLDFGGETYSPQLDHSRLKTALNRIYDLMCDQQWRTLRYIASECNCSEAGASARLRDFRKDSFKAKYKDVKEVQRKRLQGGLYAYRLLIREDWNLF